MMKNHKASMGSKVWNHVTKAWKELVSEMSMDKPSNYKEWLNSSFWWSGNNGNLGPEFSRERAAKLFHDGLQQIRHVWRENSQQFILTDEASERFGLGLAKYSNWDRIYRRLTETRRQLKRQFSTTPRANEWIRVFDSPRSDFPNVVFERSETRGLIFSNQPQLIQFNRRSLYFFVLEKSRILSMYVANDQVEVDPQHQTFFGFVSKIRIQNIVKGPKKKSILFYYGRLKDLDWDLSRFKWPQVLSQNLLTFFTIILSLDVKS
jgi:hypothetical protein